MIAVNLMVINGFCQITYCLLMMKKKESLNQKDDSTNPRQRLALKGQDYYDISLFDNQEIIWAKMSRGDSSILRKVVEQQEIEAAQSNKRQEIKRQ